MTMVLNMVYSDESISIDKTEAIINHLHEIGFLDKEKKWEDQYDDRIYFPSSTNFFKYIIVKPPDDFAGYGEIPDPEKSDPTIYEIFITFDQCIYGKNAVEIGGGDIYKDCPNLIAELEKVTRDTYSFKSEWF